MGRTVKRNRSIALKKILRLRLEPQSNTVLHVALKYTALPSAIVLRQVHASLGCHPCPLPDVWDTFSKYLFRQHPEPPNFWLSPGLDNPAMATEQAVDNLRMHVALKGKVDSYHSPHFYSVLAHYTRRAERPAERRVLVFTSVKNARWRMPKLHWRGALFGLSLCQPSKPQLPQTTGSISLSWVGTLGPDQPRTSLPW
jgi:hypothetical protein